VSLEEIHLEALETKISQWQPTYIKLSLFSSFEIGYCFLCLLNVEVWDKWHQNLIGYLFHTKDSVQSIGKTDRSISLLRLKALLFKLGQEYWWQILLQYSYSNKLFGCIFDCHRHRAVQYEYFETTQTNLLNVSCAVSRIFYFYEILYQRLIVPLRRCFVQFLLFIIQGFASQI